MRERERAGVGISVLAIELLPSSCRIATEEIAELVHFVAMNPSVNGAVLHAHGGQKQT